jgi:spore maturation protein CgeB
MKINIVIPSTKSLTINHNFENVQGDELVARLWAKNLIEDSRVTSVHLNGRDKYDVSICFSPMLKCTDGLKILYLQNIFPKPNFIGTEEIFHQVKKDYHDYIFPSEGVKNSCRSEGLVCQFATDPAIFYSRDIQKKFQHKACFVGNNIRDKETTNRYLLCASDHGLVIYGNLAGWNHPNCAGKISIDDECSLYSSSKTCLNVHLKEHLEYGSFNFRIFNILACGGFIISDKSSYLEKEFSDCMVFTEGYQDLIEKINYYSENQEKTIPFRNKGRIKVLENHTFKNRMSNLLDWLEKKV